MTQQLMAIADFQFLSEAECCRIWLQDQGFSAVLADAELVNTNWFLGNAVGYIKLQVPSDQAQLASDCLQAFRDEQRREKPNDTGADACLSCGAAMSPSETICLACGWSYGTEQEPEIEENEP